MTVLQWAPKTLYRKNRRK